MLRNKALSFFIAACIVFQSSFCFSRDDITVKEERWSPFSAGPVTTWTASLCGKGKFAIQPFLAYERVRGVFDSDGHYDSLTDGDKQYEYKQQFFIQYGISDKLEIDAQMEYKEKYARQDGSKANSNGSGDSYMFLRYCAAEEKKFIPHITGLFQLKLPTGKYQHADPGKLGTDLMGADSGGGSYDFGFGINMTKRLKPFILHADAVYSFPQEAKVDGAQTTYGRYLTYDFGAEYFLSNGFNLMVEFNAFSQNDRTENGNKIPDTDMSFFTVAPGVGWSNDKIQTLVAYQRVFSGANADAKDAILFTFVYTF